MIRCFTCWNSETYWKLQLDSPIPQAQDSELRHVGDLAAGATSEDDARVGAAQWHAMACDVPRIAKMCREDLQSWKLQTKIKRENVWKCQKCGKGVCQVGLVTSWILKWFDHKHKQRRCRIGVVDTDSSSGGVWKTKVKEGRFWVLR